MTAPALDRPTVDDVLPLVCAYTGRHNEAGEPWYEGGGSLHIVLDDGNLARGHIRWCRDHALERGDEPGALLAEVLLLLSRAQVRRLYRRYQATCSYRLTIVGVSRPLAPSEVCRLERCPWAWRCDPVSPSGHVQFHAPAQIDEITFTVGEPVEARTSGWELRTTHSEAFYAPAVVFVEGRCNAESPASTRDTPLFCYLPAGHEGSHEAHTRVIRQGPPRIGP